MRFSSLREDLNFLPKSASNTAVVAPLLASMPGLQLVYFTTPLFLNKLRLASIFRKNLRIFK